MIGFGQRLSFAIKTFLALLTSGKLPEEVVRELIPPPPPPPPPQLPPPAPKPAKPVVKVEESCDRAIQLLAILQRDGRLVDFFTEDISPFTDAQIGAAVRDIHQSCRKSLERYVKFEPVIPQAEGQTVKVAEGTDPASIKLMGNNVGKLPVSGVLRHRGWRVASIQLPPLPEEKSRTVVFPAEIET